MGHDTANFKTREIRETPWVAIVMGAFGAIVLNFWLALLALQVIESPKNLPPMLWGPYAMPVIGLALLIVGIVGYCNARVALRLKPHEFDLPRFGVTFGWADVADVRALQRPSPLLVMYLTPTGRKAIGGRCLSNSPQVDKIHPHPDVCLRCNFIGYGAELESAFDLAIQMRKWIATDRGEPKESPPLPPLDCTLELRDTSVTGPNSRTYTHDECGSGTVISDSSFYWATNPLRFTAGQCVCANCGLVSHFTLRWEDTGETLSRFRKRMWRHTSLVVKAVQFVIVPALFGALMASVVPAVASDRFAKDLSPTTSATLLFGTGFFVGNLVISLTRLSGVLPALAGYTYHNYR